MGARKKVDGAAGGARERWFLFEIVTAMVTYIFAKKNNAVRLEGEGVSIA